MEVDKIEDAPVKIVGTCVLHKMCIIADEDEGGAPPYADADNQRKGIMINLLWHCMLNRQGGNTWHG